LNFPSKNNNKKIKNFINNDYKNQYYNQISGQYIINEKIVRNQNSYCVTEEDALIDKN
jgi:hypothetical protein